MIKNLKKFTAGKLFYIILIKNCNLLIPRPPYRPHKLQEKPSALKREHPALQNMKFCTFFYFCGSFLPSWIRIQIQQLKEMDIRIQIHNVTSRQRITYRNTPAVSEEVNALISGDKQAGREAELCAPRFQPAQVRGTLAHVVNLHPHQLNLATLLSGGQCSDA
jgi:hypothetical protein